MTQRPRQPFAGMLSLSYSYQMWIRYSKTTQEGKREKPSGAGARRDTRIGERGQAPKSTSEGDRAWDFATPLRLKLGRFCMFIEHAFPPDRTESNRVYSAKEGAGH